MADILREVLRGHHQADDTGFSGHLKSILHPESTTKVLSILTLLPIGGILLALAGLILTGTVISLALVMPLFLIFSPVLVPVAIVIGLAVTGFLASGAFGVAGLTSLSWIFNYVRGGREQVPEGMEQAKRRVGEMAGMVGKRTKDAGQGIQNKANEHTGRSA